MACDVSPVAMFWDFFENGILIPKLRACSSGNGTLLGVGSIIKSDICRQNCAIVLSSSCLTSAACQIGHFHGFSWRERFPAISFASQILYREINRILIFPRQTVEPPLRTFIIIVGNKIKILGLIYFLKSLQLLILIFNLHASQ